MWGSIFQQVDTSDKKVTNELGDKDVIARMIPNTRRTLQVKKIKSPIRESLSPKTSRTSRRRKGPASHKKRKYRKRSK